jgi:iron complex outermembrane receptor protein
VTAILTQAGITNVQQAAFFTNALNTRTQGYDVTAHGAVDLPAALHLDAQLGFERSPTQVRSLAANPVLPALPLIGVHSQLLLTQAQPVSKLTSQLSLSRGPLTGTVAVTRYGQYVDAPVRDPQTFGAKTVVDLSLTLRATRWLSLTAGVLNAGDVFPDPLQEAALAYASFGGSYVYGEEGPFGVDGRSYYGRVEARF